MLFRSLAVVAMLTAGAAQAHEFWLSPKTYELAAAKSIAVDMRVGQEFKGPAYSYIPRQVTRFDMVSQAGVTAVVAKIGDRPALNMPAPSEGLVVVVHETSDSSLDYTEWAKFVKFVEHKDFAGVLDAHKARGLPEEGFSETYRRYAKTLVAVGNGAGTDRWQGMRTEIVAVTNPFTDDLSGGMTVDVIYDGSARPNAQVELFEKAPDDTVTITLHRTDDSGRATFPVKPGYEYLVDAVVLEDTGNNDASAGPVWHSLWASLTFRVPG